MGDTLLKEKKIVIITRTLMDGGAERVIAQLANYFVAHEKACTIVTVNDDDVFYQLDSRIKLIPVGRKHDKKLPDKWSRYQEVRRIVKQEQPEQLFERRQVQVGLSDGINIEIKEGLTEQDKVRGSAVDPNKKAEEKEKKADATVN